MTASEHTVDLQARPGILPNPVAQMTVCGQEVVLSSSDVSDGGKLRIDETKMRLASLLWDQISEKCNRAVSGSEAGFPARRVVRNLNLTKFPLGKPLLKSGESRGPSISFSRGIDLIWAAVCSEAEIGLDVASSAEFAGDYPFHRICNEHEYSLAVSFAQGDKSEAAAMIWSLKESYVKAIGCGYYFFDPLQVRIENMFLQEEKASFRLSLGKKARENIQAYSSRRSDSLKRESCGPGTLMIEYSSAKAYAEINKLGSDWVSVTVLDTPAL